MSNKDMKLSMAQALPLDMKIDRAKRSISEFYRRVGGQVYVSFSGGKDSTVLLHIVRSIYPDAVGVFCNTGLEYPEITRFVKDIPNITTIKPKMRFREVVEKYGWPVVSKEQAQFISELRTTSSDKLREIRLTGNKSGRGKVSKKWMFLIDAPFKVSDRCCDIMKKRPFKTYEKETGLSAIIGTMAVESQLRKQVFNRDGCNSFSDKRNICRPLSTWLDSDVWEYIKTNKLPYAEIYDKGEERTGCIACGFGCHKDDPNRIQKLKALHPKLWHYIVNRLGMKDVLSFMGIPHEPQPTIEDMFGDLENV